MVFGGGGNKSEFAPLYWQSNKKQAPSKKGSLLLIVLCLIQKLGHEDFIVIFTIDKHGILANPLGNITGFFE